MNVLSQGLLQSCRLIRILAPGAVLSFGIMTAYFLAGAWLESESCQERAALEGKETAIVGNGDLPETDLPAEGYCPLVIELVDAGRRAAPLRESIGLLSKPLSDDEITSAVRYIHSHKDYTSLHLLFQLRLQHAEVFRRIHKRDQARILASSLSAAASYNEWGPLLADESYNGPAGRTLVEVGSEAIPILIPLLQNRRPALLEGSADATLSAVLECRVCDYAYRYILQIKGRTPLFHAEVGARDAAIRELEKELQR